MCILKILKYIQLAAGMRSLVVCTAFFVFGFDLVMTQNQMAIDRNIQGFCDLVVTSQKAKDFITCIHKKDNKALFLITRCKEKLVGNGTANSVFYPYLCFNQTLMEQFGKCFAKAPRFKGLSHASNYGSALGVLTQRGTCKVPNQKLKPGIKLPKPGIKLPKPNIKLPKPGKPNKKPGKCKKGRLCG